MLTQEQKEKRREGLGGSDSPVVLGVSPFKTRQELYREKRGELTEPPPAPYMLRGTYMEDIIAQIYAEKTGRQLRTVPQTLVHEKHPFLMAHIDREILGDDRGPGVLEVKCPGLKVFGECKREGLPEYMIVQMQHYFGVSNRAWGSFAIFNAERWELIFFDVDADKELINIIEVKDAEFWQMVMDGTEPPYEIATKIDLPKIGGQDLVHLDTPEWHMAINDLREAQGLKKEAAAVEDMAKDAIKALMGEHEIVEGAGARVYFKHQKGRTRLDGAALKKAYPEIHKQFTVTGEPVRAFRPYFLKERE